MPVTAGGKKNGGEGVPRKVRLGSPFPGVQGKKESNLDAGEHGTSTTFSLRLILFSLPTVKDSNPRCHPIRDSAHRAWLPPGKLCTR